MNNRKIIFGASSPAAVAALRNAFCHTMAKDSWKVNFIHGPDPRFYYKPMQLAYILYENVPDKEQEGIPGHRLKQFAAPHLVLTGTRESTRDEIRQWLESNQGVSFVALDVDQNGDDGSSSIELYTDLSAIISRKTVTNEFGSYEKGSSAVEDYLKRGAQIVSVKSWSSMDANQKPVWKFEIELDVPLGVTI